MNDALHEGALAPARFGLPGRAAQSLQRVRTLHPLLILRRRPSARPSQGAHVPLTGHRRATQVDVQATRAPAQQAVVGHRPSACWLSRCAPYPVRSFPRRTGSAAAGAWPPGGLGGVAAGERLATLTVVLRWCERVTLGVEYHTDGLAAPAVRGTQSFPIASSRGNQRPQTRPGPV